MTPNQREYFAGEIPTRTLEERSCLPDWIPLVGAPYYWLREKSPDERRDGYLVPHALYQAVPLGISLAALIPEKWVLYPAALLRLSIPISGSKNPTASDNECPAALLRLGFFTQRFA